MKTRWMLLAVIWAAGTLSANDALRLSDDLCSLRFADGRLVIADKTGTDILAVGKVPFLWSVPCAVPKSVQRAANGRLRIAYEITNASGTNFPFSAEAYLTGHGFAVDFVSEIPPCFRSGGQMVEVFRLNDTGRSQQVTKCGYWQRCKPAVAEGWYDPGVPFEVKSMNVKPYRAKSGQVFWCRNTGWSGARTECPGFPRTSTNGVYHGRLEFVTGVDSEDAQCAAAQVDGRPFVIALATERPFNLFESGAPKFRLTVKPLIDGWRTVRTVARDFDGKVVFDQSERFEFKIGVPFVRDYALPAVEEGARGIWFIESTVGEGEREDGFARMNVAVLPPHRFTHRDTSIAAMASYPETPEAERLMERLGVSILRYGDNNHFRTNYGITAYASRHAPPEMFDPQNPKHVKIIEKEIVGRIKERGNPYFEFGNEVGWHKTHEEQTRLVKCYVSWLKVIRARLAAEGLGHVKIITFGIQPDYSAHMMRIMKDEGVFDLVDGLTLHPGRGYYTADVTHGGWVYRGIIQRARARFAELGYPDKEIHMTECYAATHPNDGWKDSLRQATENTLLSLVIASVEPNVKNMMFYKLHQGTSQDPHGYPLAHPSGQTTVNAEYDFGLLMRDDSPKPSLLSYAATCEHLDGAKFLGEKGAGTNRTDTLRAFVFDTPRGRLAVLFDRNEGGMLYKLWQRELPKGVYRDALFRHKDPWVRHWHRTKPYAFKTAGAVRVFDMIGRERPAAVKDGKFEIALDGEPVFVYGLDPVDILPAASFPAAPAVGREPSEDEYAAEEKSSGKVSD
ncbi:MAG TPA: hypothetical protein PLZ74_10165 [Kiritimatiellia bacterium]|nr:hypothetical protein [Kiritimatiellia bacterium]HOR98722.1 hypothetical protein [Kiritimatiellia bacterium]